MSTSKPRRSPKSRERQRDPERTRRLILDAAAVEFGAHGYAGARIRAIAARAGVNEQLISYYFDGKEGLYEAMSQRWRERRSELVPEGTPLPEQLRRYAMEARDNPDGPRLLAWDGLRYTGPADDPDRQNRSRMLSGSVEQLRKLRDSGELPAEIDPECLLVMLMAASMAPTVLPHIIEGVCGADARSPEFIEHFADQAAALGRLIGLPAEQPPPGEETVP